MTIIKIFIRSFLFICWTLCLASVPAFMPRPQHMVTIHFRHKVGGRELKLFDETYTNGFGEPITITRFKYYVSHLRVTGQDRKEIVVSDRSYLIDEADSSSKTLALLCPVAVIRSISFELGVDSLLNTTGVGTGDLDPLKGMFWTWNSGYIFAKLEGRSDSSHAPAHYFNWDIGGYRSPANASRTITLTIPVQRHIPEIDHKSGPATDPVLFIDADLLKWFDGRRPLKISQHPLCHQPGELAMQIADNYSVMFSITPTPASPTSGAPTPVQP